MKIINSLKFRLILILLCMAIIPVVCLSVFQLKRFGWTLTNNIIQQEDAIATVNSNAVDMWITGKVSLFESILRSHPEFKQPDMSHINSILMPIKESDTEFENCVFVDKEGNAVNTKDNSIINLAEREYFKEVKAKKKTYVSNIMLSKVTNTKVITLAVPVIDDNGDFQGILFGQLYVKNLDNILGKTKVAKTGSVALLSDRGDYIFCKDGNKVGKNYKDNFKNKNTQKIFSNDIMLKNEGVVTYNDENNKAIMATYNTVPLTKWKLIVTAPVNEVYEEFNRTERTIMIVVTIVILLIVFVSIIIAEYVAKPIRLIERHLKTLANADFTEEMPAKLLARKDEIGLLAKSVSTMRESIQSVLRNIASETTGLKGSVVESYRDLNELVSQIKDVSETTEEMSAGMEETSASAQEMNATSEEIESAVESIATKAQNGSSISDEISRRAQTLKEGILKSQKYAHNIREDIDLDIKNSIEQSKAVERINELTESILQITKQTNLLALNAAIEAARAGEAGKGFAVVADEIRKLAENSKNTANEIQQITKIVTNSVESLIRSSEKALSFIDNTVIDDYKTMVNTGEQYFSDAEAIQGLVSDFSATAEELLASIQSMIKAINEVTISNTAESQGAQNIAGKASNIMQKVSRVDDVMKETEQSSERLAMAVSRFKI